MVTKTVEPEVEKVFEAIKQSQNFILEGGAGSGKTYSLISIIEKISIEEPKKSIVCITYTNNAVAEIKSRIINDNLSFLIFVNEVFNQITRTLFNFQKDFSDIFTNYT